jgi:hypothetical protein
MRRYRVLCIVWVLLWSTTALAQTRAPQDAREQASAHFQRGVELFEDGAFRAALVEFRRAYDIAPNYRLLFNIGQTQLELQDFLGAAHSYEDFLLQGGSQVSEAQRVQLEGALQALRARVGRIVVAVSRDGGEVFLDDNSIGTSPISSTIPVNVGQHRISVRHADGGTGSKVVEVTGGEIAEISIELSAPTPKTVVMAGDGHRPLASKLAIIGWGAGGAVLIGSLVTGVLAMSADKDFDELLSSVITDPKKESEQRNKIKTLVLTTDVLLATGVVVAAAGTVMWMLGRREEKKREEERKQSAKLGFDVGLGSVSLRGQF